MHCHWSTPPTLSCLASQVLHHPHTKSILWVFQVKEICSLDLKGYTDAKLNVLSWICQLMLSHTYTPRFTDAESNIHFIRYADAKSNVHSSRYASFKSDLLFWKRLMTFYFTSRDHACVFLNLASMLTWILPPHWESTSNLCFSVVVLFALWELPPSSQIHTDLFFLINVWH